MQLELIFQKFYHTLYLLKNNLYLTSDFYITIAQILPVMKFRTCFLLTLLIIILPLFVQSQSDIADIKYYEEIFVSKQSAVKELLFADETGTYFIFHEPFGAAFGDKTYYIEQYDNDYKLTLSKEIFLDEKKLRFLLRRYCLKQRIFKRQRASNIYRLVFLSYVLKECNNTICFIYNDCSKNWDELTKVCL